MKQSSFKLILIFCVIGLGYEGQAQITTDNTLTIEQLVNEVLLGDGVTASNITFNGSAALASTISLHNGTYNATNSPFPIDTGLVMATSTIDLINGGFGTPIENYTDDPDLVNISGGFNMNNCSVIEFDFTVNSDSLLFEYIFASAEYPSFTCSSFNDVFGFFLSGPGINGPFTGNAANIALIPNSNVPVGVNTLNSGVPSGGGSPNPCLSVNPNFVEDSQYFVPNPPANSITIQGHTVVLTARAAIECGGTYHIKLAIGNASDQALQSAVFLKAGSFSASGQVFATVEPSLPGVDLSLTPFDGVVVAGCFSPFLQFVRPPGAPVGSVTVGYGGTAIEGTDYELGPNSSEFSFSEGVDTLNFFINTFPNPAAGDKLFLEFYVSYEACGGTVIDTISIPIIQPYAITGEAEDVIVTCPADSVVVTVLGIGGIEPYVYNWVGINPGASVLVAVPEAEQYFVYEILDQCEFQTFVDSVLVTNNIPPPLMMTIPQPTSPLCPSEPVLITAVIAGGNGEYFYDWSPEPSATNSLLVDFIQTTEVSLTVTDTCGTQVQNTVLIEYPLYDSLQVTFTRPTDNCPDAPLELDATVTGGGGEVQFIWTQDLGEGEFVNSDTEQLAIVRPRPGKNIYTVEVTDRCHRLNLFGFTPGIAAHTDSIQIIYLDEIPNVITPNGDGMNDIFVIEGIQEFQDARVEIYDRWGRLVYESDSYPAGNPTIINSEGFGGADINDGTYFYVVNVDSGECVKSGSLQVLAGQD